MVAAVISPQPTIRSPLEFGIFPPPATWGCHPPPENDSPAQRETGDRNDCFGYDSFPVTGDGRGSRPFGSQPFSHQPPEAGCQHLMAERPAPELPSPVPVTCHPKVFSANYPVPGLPLSLSSSRHPPPENDPSDQRENRRSEWLLRSYIPSQLSGLPMVPPLSNASVPR